MREMQMSGTPTQAIFRIPGIFSSISDLIAAESTRHGGVSPAPFDSLNLSVHNDELPIAMPLLAYVGRHEIEDIECLHALSLSSGADFGPTVENEILVPVMGHGGLLLPQMIEKDSLEFMKLTHRYPELYSTLQKKSLPRRRK